MSSEVLVSLFQRMLGKGLFEFIILFPRTLKMLLPNLAFNVAREKSRVHLILFLLQKLEGVTL